MASFALIFGIVLLCTLGLVLLFFLLLILFVAPGRYPKNDPAKLLPTSGAEPTPIAHRGLHDNGAGVPENSMAAFSAALEEGVGVELDLNLTTDDQVVVFHDDTLLRVCGVDKKVCECSYEELQQYALLGTEQRIPLFSEVLACMGGRQTMIVELKYTPRYSLLCEKACAMLRAYEGPYCIESFYPGIVRWFRKNAPEIVRGQLAMGGRRYGQRWQGLLMGNLLTNLATRPHFEAFHYPDVPGSLPLFLYKLLGGKRVAWTVRDAKDYRLYKRYFDVVIYEGRDTPKA